MDETGNGSHFRLTSRWALPWIGSSSQRAFYVGFGLILLGVAFLGWRQVLTDRHQGWPLQIPISFAEEGRVFSGEFVAELPITHELELEFLQGTTVSKDLWNRNVIQAKVPSELGVGWAVRLGERLVAKGDSREYIYIDYGGGVGLKRLLKWYLNRPLTPTRQAPVTARGVGQFVAEPGQTYSIEVRLERAVPELDLTQPHFNVRIHRLFWLNHLGSTRIWTFLSTLVLGLGGFVLGWTFLLKTKVGKGIGGRAENRAGTLEKLE